MSERIDVALGERSYPMHVGSGLLARAGELLAPLARGAVSVVTDSNVAPLQLEALAVSLRTSGLLSATAARFARSGTTAPRHCPCSRCAPHGNVHRQHRRRL